jgi:CheY-like chemotaxis protein
MAASTILIVDDDDAVRAMLRRLLRPRAVIEASDAMEALDQLVAHDDISVAIIDRLMPDRDGLWLIARIREQFPNVAIILATGVDWVPSSFPLGPAVVSYLVKPIEPHLLIDAVNFGLAWHFATKRAG